MRPFPQFVLATIRSNPVISACGVLLMLLGINVQQIEQYFFEHPPRVLTQWWAPYAFAAIGLWLVTYVCWRQSEAQRNLAPHADWSGKDALTYLWHRSKWTFQMGPDKHHRRILDAADEMRDAARQGRIRVWGRSERDSFPGADIPAPLAPIPNEYWDRASFDPRAMLGDDVELATQPNDTRTLTYTDVRFNQGEVLAAWKPAGIFVRTWRRLRTRSAA